MRYLFKCSFYPQNFYPWKEIFFNFKKIKIVLSTSSVIKRSTRSGPIHFFLGPDLNNNYNFYLTKIGPVRTGWTVEAVLLTLIRIVCWGIALYDCHLTVTSRQSCGDDSFVDRVPFQQ